MQYLLVTCMFSLVEISVNVRRSSRNSRRSTNSEMSAHSIFSGMTLKDLLKNPDLQRAPAALNGDSNRKVDKSSNGMAETDFTAAFLGPQLWDKTYKSSNFNLEYMDLDEFLCQNLDEVPVLETSGLDHLIKTPLPQKSVSLRLSPNPRVSLNPRVSPGPHIGTSSHVSPKQVSPPHSPHSPSFAVTRSYPHAMVMPTMGVSSSSNFVLRPKVETAEEAVQKPGNTRCTSPGEVSSGSTAPVSPLPVRVDFSLTEQDLALTSVPGQSTFDPTCHTFTEDELKPQPVIKKSKKIFVPDEQKDDKYWARRKKNNHAAKRSRDAKRIKENQIAMRAAYLEKESMSIREEIEKIRCENAHLKHRLSKYEPSA